jgi:hypothetical protein
MKTCVLCGLDFDGWGNNPEPVARFEEGQCCDRCNQTVVLNARIGRIQMGLPTRDTDNDKEGT